ncbi:hypothetical protein SCP_1001170 [Sparassis crispa]|uniref:Uncharacterized protein n=1 Tax=Sparassis crispa TaxID=139825 RepID=A0A401GXC0_9APHY|nr:hypothetical protein SCP_1001170 [Sparassis crispa]GBE86875.1 hypothetical protein SCP_1001170 [Sparassis crispa]
MADPPLNAAEQAELRRRFPRAGWWLGMPGVPAPSDIRAFDANQQDLGRHYVIPESPAQQMPPYFAPPPYPPPPYLPPHYNPPPYAAPGAMHFAPPPMYQLAPQMYMHPPPPPELPPHVLAQPVTRQISLNIDVSIPLNTGVVGGTVSRIELKLPTDLPFIDFFSRVCARMDLDPTHAELGYKFHTDKRCEAPHQLANEEQLRGAMACGIGLIQRARSRQIILEIHNLKPAHEAAVGNSRKRKADDIENPINPELQTTVSFTKELRQLKGRLSCAAHPGRWCFISPINSEHKFLDIFAITLWAKQMLLGDATLQNPPESVFFDHTRKKPRLSRNSVASASTPNVNVVVTNNIPPLGDQMGQRRVNTPSSSQCIDLTVECDDETISYPSVIVLLADMLLIFPDYDLLQYHSALTNSGVIDIKDFQDTDDSSLLAAGLPADVIDTLRDHAAVLIHQQVKGKSIMQN